MGIFTEFLKHPRKIGAIAPSGKRLSAEMMAPIDFAAANVIVEYGPGTGSFTKELIARRRPGTVLILIEQNKAFCERLKTAFDGLPNLFIMHGSAENVGRYLEACGVPGADYIVSGLPFTSLPAAVSDQILNAVKPVLGQDGKFITFQYSLVKKKFFEHYFQMTDCRKVIKNLPPAFVLVMKNYEGQPVFPHEHTAANSNPPRKQG